MQEVHAVGFVLQVQAANVLAERQLEHSNHLQIQLSVHFPPFAFCRPIPSCRLIDEMRSSIRCKAHKKYMDVGIRAPKGFFFWY